LFSRRAPLIGFGAAGGLVMGSLLWIALGSGAAAAARLDDLQARLDGLRAPSRSAWASVDPANLASSPLFAMTTGPGAVAEPSVALQGVARTPGGSSALISIDGKPADWLAEGATRDGVTVQEVRSSSVLVDTVTGLKEVALGQKIGPASPSTVGGAPTAAAGAPTGYRLPPPPASAPQAGG
jgi:hypothetical protein